MNMNMNNNKQIYIYIYIYINNNNNNNNKNDRPAGPWCGGDPSAGASARAPAGPGLASEVFQVCISGLDVLVGISGLAVFQVWLYFRSVWLFGRTYFRQKLVQ